MKAYDKGEHLRLLAIQPERRTAEQVKRLAALAAALRENKRIAAMHALANLRPEA